MQKKNIFILTLVLIFNQNISYSEWKLVHSEQYEDVQSIDCPDSNNCFALVNNPSTPVLYKSTDQGSTWILIYEDNKSINPSVEDGVSTHPDYYFIANYYYSSLQKSTDKGLTFKEITLDNGHFGFGWTLRDLAMWDTLYGFVTNGYNYFTTTDGWETFLKHPKLRDDQTYYSPIFLDSNTVVMTSFVTPPLDTHNHMTFMKYHLKENTWDTLFYFESEFKKWANNVTNLFFISDSVGFGCGDGVDFDLPSGNYHDIIYKTTDRGYHWELIHKKYQYPEIGLTNNIAFADEKNGIAVGFYGKIAMTNDGGDSWVYEPTPNAMDNARKMLVCWAGRTPLIGTWDAGIFRYEGDFFKFSVGVEDREITNYEIRITPNPASEYIEINFGGEWKREKGEGTREIRIFNVYGRQMSKLTSNTPLAPLERGIGNGVMIDVSCFPIGIYFMRYANKTYNFIKY